MRIKIKKGHQIICVKRINERNVKQRMLVDPDLSGEFIRCSIVSEILSKSFAVLILCNFLIKQKVELVSFPFCQGADSSLSEKKE